jgi:glycosyltransferase involved in cell wall biosynthesis
MLVNPENVFEIQRGMQRALLDPAMRAQMKQRGYEQAQRFSWTTSVLRILEIYREVAGARVARGVAAD